MFGSEHSIALTVSLQNSLGQIRNGLYFTVQEEAAYDQSGLLCMMDTVMTRPRRFTLESGKRSSELLGLAQLHVAASLLSPRSAVSARHLLQQPHVPRVPRHVPSSCATLTCRASSHGRTSQLELIQVVLNVRKE